MKGESQKSWKVVKLKGRNLQLETPRPYSKVIQNLWQKKLIIDYWRWLYIKLSLIWTSLIQVCFLCFDPRDRSQIQGNVLRLVLKPTPQVGRFRVLVKFWCSSQEKKTQRLAWTASHGVAQEAGNGWLAARLMPFIPKLNGGSEWYYDKLSSKMITPHSDICDTQGLKELKEVNTGG